MGKVKCPKHNVPGLIITCSHVGEEIDSGHFPKARKFKMIGTLLICDQCTKLIDLEKYKRMDEAGAPDSRDPRWDDYFEAWAAAYDALKDYRIFCPACVKELGQGQAG